MSHLCNFLYSFLSYGPLKLSKMVQFLNICADLSKKPKYIKASYFYPSERPHHALPEYSSFYRGPRY